MITGVGPDSTPGRAKVTARRTLFSVRLASISKESTFPELEFPSWCQSFYLKIKTVLKSRPNWVFLSIYESFILLFRTFFRFNANLSGARWKRLKQGRLISPRIAADFRAINRTNGYKPIVKCQKYKLTISWLCLV